ncbi:MAG: hypothetical protein V8Q42_10495 [Anaerovoracaceae bacterium]
MKKAAERRGTGRKTVNRLAVSSIRKNRSRSALIMLSVFLSTVLLTMISSYGMGLAKYERSQLRYSTVRSMACSWTSAKSSWMLSEKTRPSPIQD